jgi:uncharacterized membrane protein YgdD (TMEM256/DUF423 family)
MNRTFLLFAAFSGAWCVAFGAMGAHFLEKKITAPLLDVYETGVRYQFFHTFAILAAGILAEKFPGKLMVWSGRFFIAGIVLFSGSLYFLSLRPLLGISETEMRWLGMITPFGGLSFIAGWLLLFISIYKKRT